MRPDEAKRRKRRRGHGEMTGRNWQIPRTAVRAVEITQDFHSPPGRPSPGGLVNQWLKLRFPEAAGCGISRGQVGEGRGQVGEGRMVIDQSVEDYLMLTLIGWSVMIVVTYVALAIRLAV